MMRPNRFLACVTAVAALIVTTACVEPVPNPAPEPTVQPRPPQNVGIAIDIPGFSELISLGDNTRVGFDVELARWLGANTDPGFQPVLVPITIEERLDRITDTSLTYVVDAFSITDGRREQIGMAGPYLLTRQGVLTRTDARPVESMDDLSGHQVCTVTGSTSEGQLRLLADQKRIVLTSVTGNSECIDRMLAGYDDAFSTDQVVLSGFAAKHPGMFRVSNYTFGRVEEYGVAYPKGDRARCEALRAAIQKFIVDGTWTEFFARHFPNLDPDDGYRPEANALDPCPP